MPVKRRSIPQNKPPVPDKPPRKTSLDDRAERKGWKVGSIVEVYSASMGGWKVAKVTEVVDEKYITVMYGDIGDEVCKTIFRFDKACVRPHRFTVSKQRGQGSNGHVHTTT